MTRCNFYPPRVWTTLWQNYEQMLEGRGWWGVAVRGGSVA